MIKFGLILLSLGFVAIEAQIIHNYEPICNPKDTVNYQFYDDVPKIKTKKGYEVFIQAPLYADINSSPEVDLLKYPFNETFFIRDYVDHEKGSMYIMFKHQMIQLLHNRKANESILVDYQYGTCDVQPMIYEKDYTYGYFHGTERPIHVPFLEDLADLTKFRIKKLGVQKRPYRGFRDVTAYETCVELRDMVVRILSELSAIDNIPDAIIQAVPSVPVKAIWYWSDPKWEMEDGLDGDPTLLGIDFTGQVTIKATPRLWLEASVNVSMSMANFHSQYPPGDTLEELLQVPPYVSCNKRIFAPGDEPKPLPPFPSRFHIKTESIIWDEKKDFVYNTEEYYDYDQKRFRFDISLHRPDREGPQMLELLHDYNENVAYKIDRGDKSCERKDLTELNGRYENSVITHMLMRPYDLLKIEDTNPIYIGKKHCRGMNCHYYTGSKNLDILAQDGNKTFGIFSIWATTDKWSANFSTADLIMPNYIVKMVVEIFNLRTGKPVGRTQVDIFDYGLLSSKHDYFFLAPDAVFCGNANDPSEMPIVPNRYQFQGEYSEHEHNYSYPIFLNYDSSWNVIRFDYIPRPDRHHQDLSYRMSEVFDRRSATVYRINRITNQCTTGEIADGYNGWDQPALQLAWPPTLHDQISERLLIYLGVVPCRRMFCDTFEHTTAVTGEPGRRTYNYEFLAARFHTTGDIIPGVEEEHALARIAHHHWEGDTFEPNRSQSIDIYDFTNQRSTYWEYEVAWPCFANVRSSWLRAYFTTEKDEALAYAKTDFFRVELMEQIRKASANLSPIRIAMLSARVPDGDNKVTVEFLLHDRHPAEKYKGPSLDDAINELQTAFSYGNFTVKIIIPDPDGKIQEFEFNAQNDLDVCNNGRPCSAPDPGMPTIELDVGALVGTIIGSVIAGILVIGIVLTLVVSRKHNVPMKNLYVGDTAASSNNTGRASLVNDDKTPNDDM